MISRDGKPLILTFILLIASVLFMYFSSSWREVSLWVDVGFFTLVNIGLIIALILGVKSKNKSVFLYSLLLNSVFLTIGMVTVFVYVFLIFAVQLS